MKKSFLALLLIVALLMSTMPVCAYTEGEEVYAELAEPEIGEIDAILDEEAGQPVDPADYRIEADEAEADELELFLDGDSDGSDNAPEDWIETVETSEFVIGEPASMDITEDNENGPSSEEPVGVDDDSPFTGGYFVVVSAENVICEVEGAWPEGPLPVDTVLYAFDRDAEGRLAVCFAAADGIVRGWIEAASLRPMSAEETEAFTAAASAIESTVYFDEANTLPLYRMEDVPADTTSPTGEGNGEPVGGDPSGAQPPEGDPAQDETVYAIELSVAALTVRERETAKLKVKTIAKDAGAVSWSVEDDSIASISETGKVTGVSVGETRVFATAENGDRGVCAVTVGPEPTAIHFKVSKKKLGLNEYAGTLRTILDSDGVPFTGKVTFTTSNKRYVTVSSDGTIKGVRRGSATITAKIYNGKKATCKVTVYKAPAKIAASLSSVTLGLGETRTLSYTLSSGSAGRVTWKSSKPEAVSVDSSGKITALDTKKAKITLRTYNGKTATVTVNVLNAPESITLAKESITIGVGQTYKLNGSVNEGAAGRLVYASRNPECASTSGSKITGVAVDTTTVDVSTYVDIPAASCEVIVKAAPKSVSLPYKTLNLGVGNSFKLKPVLPEGTAAGFTYTTSNKKYVTVTSSGTVKGVKAGSATITVKTHNGKTCKLKIVVKKAPGKITASPRTKKLGLGETFKLGYKLPAGTYGTVSFKPFDEASAAVLDVDEATGIVTGKEKGEGTVRVTTFNGKKDDCVVQVLDAPEWISTDFNEITLGVDQTRQIVCTLPEGSASALTYESEDKTIAKVSSSGVITAKGIGTTKITVRTFVPEVYAEIDVTVMKAPSSVTLDESSAVRYLDDEPLVLTPHIPENSMTAFTFSSSDTKIAKISADGVVTYRKRGKTTLTVKTHNGKKAQMTLRIYDPNYPEKISLVNNVPVLTKGDSYGVEYTVKPERARECVRWKSSNTSVATIDQTGMIQAVGFGYSTISIISTADSSIKYTFTIAVQTEDYSLVIPKRTTSIAGIDANMQKIYSIRDSALGEIDRLYEGGVISKSDADKRTSMVKNIFKSYAFPWMTPAKQKYWKAANSENGAKDFKPDRVYYGLPYISGTGTNRAYNKSKAVGEGRFTDTGDGYYMLNQKKLLNGKYVGCDCSGLCNTAIWGVQSSHTYDRTCDIAVSSAYKKGNFDDMRPGDLICKGYAHVVMFLYYANSDRSKIMIIENGGSEKGTNTVHCSVMNISTYRDKGYKVRRRASLG